MSQIALPLGAGAGSSPPRIVVGNANAAAIDAFANTARAARERLGIDPPR